MLVLLLLGVRGVDSSISINSLTSNYMQLCCYSDGYAKHVAICMHCSGPQILYTCIMSMSGPMMKCMYIHFIAASVEKASKCISNQRYLTSIMTSVLSKQHSIAALQLQHPDCFNFGPCLLCLNFQTTSCGLLLWSKTCQLAGHFSAASQLQL